MKADATVTRLQGTLLRYAQAYSTPRTGIWARLIDRHLQGAARRGAAFFLSMTEVSEAQLDVLRETGLPEDQMTPQLMDGIMRDLSALTALGTWQVTRGIYRLDHTLLRELWDTPLTGDLPGEVLRRLPEWCVYVETPLGATHLGLPLLGFWAHLDPDPRGLELRLLPDLQPPAGETRPLWLPLGIPLGGTLEQGVATYFQEQSAPRELYDWARGAVSALLYLCGPAPEYAGPRPQVVTAKALRRIRHAARQDMPAYVLGQAIGAQIRAGRSAPSGAAAGGEKRPHWRGPRWTTVWTGKGKVVPEVRWEPGMLIRADRLGEDGPMVVHPVHARE